MSSIALILIAAVVLVAIEGVFFLYCFRWLAGGKRQREKEFALLDSERTELLQLQASLASDLAQAKKMSEETLARLTQLGADAHAEWIETTSRIDAVLADVERRTQELTDQNLTQLNKHRLSLEKMCHDSHVTEARLLETLGNAKKLLRFFEKNVPSDEIVKELQVEKYSEARKLLASGNDASHVARKLGLSVSEVALLSHLR